MSKRHQSSRRRNYGRRQHELHERLDRGSDEQAWLDVPDLEEGLHRWGIGQNGRDPNEGLLRLRSVD